LNLNKNFSNNNGSDFSTIVNRQLEIKPNTEVALFAGNIVRAPIVIDSDTTLQVQFNSSFPNATQQSYSNIAGATITPLGQEADIVFPKGSYSTQGFCQRLCGIVNNDIIARTRDSNVQPFPEPDNTFMKQACPYRLYYVNNNGQFFLGLRYFIDDANLLDGNFKTTFLELNTGHSTSNGVTINGTYQKSLQAKTRVDDWSSWAMGNSPVRGGAYAVTEYPHNPEVLTGDIAFSQVQTKGALSVAPQAQEFFYCFSNTWNTEKWQVNGVQPDLARLYTDVDLPEGYLGAYFDMVSDTGSYTTQNVFIVANEELSNADDIQINDANDRDAFLQRQYRILAQVNLTSLGIKMEDYNTFRWEFYCEDIPDNGLSPDNFNEKYRQYYFRFMTRSAYEQGANKIIYDSKQDSMTIGAEIVEGGYLFQQLENPSDPSKQVSAGLCPQFYFKNTEEDFTLLNPRANNIVTDLNQETNFTMQVLGIDYQFSSLFNNLSATTNSNPTDLKNVMGITEQSSFQGVIDLYDISTFNPNSYPVNPNEGGINQLNSDGNRYNIELNLPVRAYNNTQNIANDIGQQRTIIYNVEPVLDYIEPNQKGWISKNIQPNEIKYLSLNNPNSIKLNELKVQIRRAKTNEIASEINDASIELLIKKE